MDKLLLGSGAWNWSDWTTVDADPQSGANYIHPLPPLPEPVRAQTWDVIMAVHFIEHLYVWDALELITQCHACLNKGGVLILEQPDIAFCARVLLGLETPPPGGAEGQFDLWGFYGDPTARNPYYGHHWGYTPDSLRALVIQAGFQAENVSIQPAQYHQPVRDFRLEAVR